MPTRSGTGGTGVVRGVVGMGALKRARRQCRALLDGEGRAAKSKIAAQMLCLWLR